MTSLKTMAENEKIKTSNNIRPEFNELMSLENRTKGGFRYVAATFAGEVKVLKKWQN
jgi:hypothetical protein